MNLDLFADPPAEPKPFETVPVKRDLEACKYCQAWHMPVDSLPWRKAGYCSEGCCKKGTTA